MKSSYRFLMLSFLFIIFNAGFTFAEAIIGYVMDATTSEPLPGANIYLKETILGSATDLKGKFEILNVPPGKYVLVANYIGYDEKIQEIEVKAGKPTSVVINLTFKTLEGEVIEVTAQAEGQMAAINQQVSSNSIVNVVSEAKIRELPDANAAESVGRLPGVSVLRSGGEGTKVVIRGLSPQYNTININGVRMAASGSGDRSSDLSMISPYMLEGIEVSKAATVEQDADVLGGSVNFKIKKAPKEFKIDALLQGGYNRIARTYNNYKMMLGLSNRYFNNSLGVFGQFIMENRNRSSQEFGANYAMDDLVLRDVYFTTLNLDDIFREKKRYGATLVFDYDLPQGNLVFSNFGSLVDNNNYKHGEKHDANNNVHTYTASETENALSVMVNSLEFNYTIGDFKINALAANSFTENKTPFQLLNSFDEGSAYNNIDKYGDPREAPKTARNNLDNTYMQRIQMISSYNKENETTFGANFSYDFSIGKYIGAIAKIGGKYRHKNRLYDKNEDFMPINWGGRQAERDLLLDTYPWMQDYFDYGDLVVPMRPFIDGNYKANDFLAGEYDITYGLNLGLLKDVYDLLSSTGNMWHHFPSSLKDDYSGFEDYSAGYAAVELNIGSNFVVIPGIRYENNFTSYSANRGDESVFLAQDAYQYRDTTMTRNNSFWLPNLHIKYKPLDWMSIKFAYTNTLTRPSYAQIIPKWNITSTMVKLGNPNLKPATSTNFDLNVSVYENYVGLFAIGGFLKKINNLIFYTGPRVITESEVDEFGFPDYTLHNNYATFINNKFDVDLWGLETEWQTHFWYLPGVFKGLVLNVNYTHIFSEARYPKTDIEVQYNQWGIPVSFTNIDTFYTNRLVNQPDDIVNVSLGFDYKGFSGRLSLLYQSNIFKRNHIEPELRGYTEDYWRWDLVINQKLPVEGLMLYFNFNNISGTFDRAIVAGPKFPTSEQHYGYTIDLGLRYNL